MWSVQRALQLEEMRCEAQHLYWCLFRRDAPPPMIDAYLRAHIDIPELRVCRPDQEQTIRVIVTKRLDAASIEPWLRGGPRRHLLSSKLLLVAYLAESDGQHSEFARRSRGGWTNIVLTGIRAGAALLRGGYLKMRHGLV